MIEKKCPKCGHHTLIKSGIAHFKDEGDKGIWDCTICDYIEIEGYLAFGNERSTPSEGKRD